MRARGRRRSAQLDPRAYRTFNLIIADNRDAFWLRHADETARRRSTATRSGRPRR